MDAHVYDIELGRSYEQGLRGELSSGRNTSERLERGGKEDTLQTLASDQAPTEVDREALEQYLGDVKNRLAKTGVELKFTFHEESGALQVELINSENDKIVRKIPPDELVKLASSLKEMAGAFLNRSV